MVYVAVVHSVQDDFDVLSTTSVTSQGGADFFTINSFVEAVAVCSHFALTTSCSNI